MTSDATSPSPPGPGRPWPAAAGGQDTVVALVAAAAQGDDDAWNELVDRYSPLVAAVVRRHRLGRAQAEDVAQTVWLRLVEHLGRLRDAQALPKWLITTARHECLRQLGHDSRAVPHDPQSPRWIDLDVAAEDSDEALLRAERHEALLAGLAELPRHQRELLLILVEDPAPSYAEISARLGIPVGSIGPTRGRAVERLRASGPLRAFLTGDEAGGAVAAPRKR